MNFTHMKTKLIYKSEVLIKHFLKLFLEKFSINFFQRPLAFSIINNEFQQLKKTKVFKNREDLWDYVLTKTNKRLALTYIEFGVLEGYSINYFSKKHKNPKSKFIGLDSFKGLSDDWDNIPKGTLNLNGVVPQIKDKRVGFLKGWFNDTTNVLLKYLVNRRSNNFIVNYDADIYGSTLFALVEMDSLKKEYFAIFDEFAGHESRALYNYKQSHGAEIEFLARTMYNYQPWTVLCKIKPRNIKKSKKMTFGSFLKT